MELRELKVGGFYWWFFGDDDAVLVKLRYVGRDYISVQIVAGTPGEVLRCGYGVGDAVSTSPQCLRAVTEADKNA